MLVERMDKWLPKLSGELQYSQKTYPVLIHGVPTSFNTSRDSKDVIEGLTVKTQIYHHAPSCASEHQVLGRHSWPYASKGTWFPGHILLRSHNRKCLYQPPHCSLWGAAACIEVLVLPSTLFQLSLHGPPRMLLQGQTEMRAMCRGT